MGWMASVLTCFPVRPLLFKFLSLSRFGLELSSKFSPFHFGITFFRKYFAFYEIKKETLFFFKLNLYSKLTCKREMLVLGRE